MSCTGLSWQSSGSCVGSMDNWVNTSCSINLRTRRDKIREQLSEYPKEDRLTRAMTAIRHSTGMDNGMMQDIYRRHKTQYSLLRRAMNS
mmetsp:Transcript_3139/g.4858  ORF Transcript_3139/g.4858 Transcript_3139/m.4858 type:complete len:89 (+) Transcript_3139:759-1025(+)